MQGGGVFEEEELQVEFGGNADGGIGFGLGAEEEVGEGERKFPGVVELWRERRELWSDELSSKYSGQIR